MANLPSTYTLERTTKAQPVGLVLLVHHDGGSRKTLWRHQYYYLKRGYDVLSHDFIFHGQNFWHLPINLRKKWISEFESVVNVARFSNRSRLLGVHSLSAFCSVTLSWYARQNSASKLFDFFVFENGPFRDVGLWTDRVSKHVFKIQSKRIRKVVNQINLKRFDSSYEKEFTSDIRRLATRSSRSFPRSLFFISENDAIVQPDDILKTVESLPNSAVARIPGSGHIEAIKKSFHPYASALDAHLREVES